MQPTIVKTPSPSRDTRRVSVVEILIQTWDADTPGQLDLACLLAHSCVELECFLEPMLIESRTVVVIACFQWLFELGRHL